MASVMPFLLIIVMKKQLAIILIGITLTASLIACDSDEITSSTETATPAPRTTATPDAKVIPTFAPIPTPEPVSFQREGDSFVVKGSHINVRWFDEDHIFIGQSTLTFGANPLYIADLNTLKLDPVFEIQSSDVVRSDATWINKDWVAWLEGGYYSSDIEPPGKLFVMNLNDHQKRMIAEQGIIATALPDGSLVIRTGWVDGPIQLLTSPYDAPPTEIAPAGFWTQDWFLNPDGETLAWVEMDPPSDPKHSLPDYYLPDLLDNSTTNLWPQVRSIALWNRISNEVKHIKVEDMAWPYIDLFWTKDSRNLLFQTDVINGQGQIALTKMALDGSVSTLFTIPFYGHVRTLAEGPDSSLYLQVGSWNWNGDRRTENTNEINELLRLYPDGTTETVIDKAYGGTKEISANQLKVIGENEAIWSVDLNTGIPNAISTPGSCSEYSTLSPGGHWLIEGTDCRPTRITPAHQN